MIHLRRSLSQWRNSLGPRARQLATHARPHTTPLIFLTSASTASICCSSSAFCSAIFRRASSMSTSSSRSTCCKMRARSCAEYARAHVSMSVRAPCGNAPGAVARLRQGRALQSHMRSSQGTSTYVQTLERPRSSVHPHARIHAPQESGLTVSSGWQAAPAHDSPCGCGRSPQGEGRPPRRTSHSRRVSLCSARRPAGNHLRTASARA